jgi:hypothetical protein
MVLESNPCGETQADKVYVIQFTVWTVFVAW